MTSKQVVIVGGGVGGITAANELRARLSKKHRVVLVERNREHAFAPSYLWVMTGNRQPRQITRDLRTLLRPDVELVQADVKSVDISAGRVETSTRSLDFDFLIIALGAELAPELVPGLDDTAHTFYTLPGSIRLHDALRACTGGKIAVVVAGTPYKCPGAPHEGAMLIADCMRRRGLTTATQVHLFTPEPQPLPVAGPELGELVRSLLLSKGIEFHPLHKLNRVDTGAKQLIFDTRGSVDYDLLVVIPPHRAPEALRISNLTNEGGWVPVDRNSLATHHENVFALGDAAALSIPGRWKPEVPMMLPKAGVFAHAQAHTVARNLAARLEGRDPTDLFCGDGYCMLEVGEDLAGFAHGNFFGEPSPQVQLKRVGKSWHIGKVLFEQWWLAPFGLKRALLRNILRWGAKGYGIPDVL
ncbi:FAD-dependent oxidoreductase [candidate division KSB1 bacterium]|nr:FAD-dependent oxidoreductase [candidate division KSB1 bacterium]